jgi:hypothetical protein
MSRSDAIKQLIDDKSCLSLVLSVEEIIRLVDSLTCQVFYQK